MTRENDDRAFFIVDSRDLFDREHQLWSRLTHPNLVQFFGYSLKDDYALIEHSNLGDLYSYLHTSYCLQPNQPSLSFVLLLLLAFVLLLIDLIDPFRMHIRLLIVTQICNALRYLESEKIVHRDIAARNCLIYPNYEIKLTNSALASSDFQPQYFSLDAFCRVPIRWMAPEVLAKVKIESMLSFRFHRHVVSSGRIHCAIGRLVLRHHLVGSDDALRDFTVFVAHGWTSLSTIEINGNESRSILRHLTIVQTRMFK